MVFGIMVLAGAVLGAIFCWATHTHCELFGCKCSTIVDCENRRVYQRCSVCGKESQYDFQMEISGTDWIGFSSGENKCPLCMGWKPKAWKFCSSSYCEMNPKGPIRRV